MFEERQLARIRPDRILSFFVKDSCPPTAWLSITNTTDTRIAFKIKTTSPESYQVQSHRGLIEARTCVDIPVVLKREGQCTLRNDRFAILVMRVGGEKIRSKRELDRKWICAASDGNPDVYMEQRLRCALVPYSSNDSECRSKSKVAKGNACCFQPSGDREGEDNEIIEQPTRTSCDDNDCLPIRDRCILETQQELQNRINSLSRVNTFTVVSIIVILVFLFFIHFSDQARRSRDKDDCDCCGHGGWWGFGGW